jgi:hypothetical protein
MITHTDHANQGRISFSLDIENPSASVTEED